MGWPSSTGAAAKEELASILWPPELEEETGEEDEFVAVDSRSDAPACRLTDKRVLRRLCVEYFC